MHDISNIHNLRLLESIYKDDLNAYEKICDAYNSESLMIILSNCDNVAYFFDEFEENQEKITQMLHSRDFSIMFWRRFSLRYTEYDRHFYFKIYTKLNDTKKLLSEINNEIVLGVYKKFSPRNYKKRTEHFFETINKIKQLPSADQDIIWELIFSHDL